MKRRAIIFSAYSCFVTTAAALAQPRSNSGAYTANGVRLSIARFGRADKSNFTANVSLENLRQNEIEFFVHGEIVVTDNKGGVYNGHSSSWGECSSPMSYCLQNMVSGQLPISTLEAGAVTSTNLIFRMAQYTTQGDSGDMGDLTLVLAVRAAGSSDPKAWRRTNLAIQNLSLT